MKNLILVLILLFSLETYSQVPNSNSQNLYRSISSTTTQLSNEWNSNSKIWFDEFNGTSIDEDKWFIIPRQATHSYRPLITDDLSFYKVERGICTLKTDLIDGTLYSAMMDSYIGSIQETKFFRYGYFEASCNIEYDNETFPAFWLWADKKNTPIGDPLVDSDDYSEIDIFEANGNESDKRLLHTIHRALNIGNYHNDNLKVSHLRVIYNDTSFHNTWYTYAVEWMPNYIIYYINGQVMHEFRYGENTTVDLRHMYPLKIKFNTYLFDMNDLVNPPDYLKIDWVRVYQLEMGTGNPYIPTIFSTGTDTDHKIHLSILLKGYQLPTNDRITFRASDYIIIDSGFEVPLGTDFTATINEQY